MYEAYVPDPLIGRPITLAGETAADIADAEAAVIRLNLQARSLIDSEAVARLLLRAEAIASSRIEGLEVGGRRLLHAQAEQVLGERPSDVTALEVLNNIEAMNWAIAHLSDPNRKITTDDLLDIHRHLLAGTRLDEYAGKVRTEQNWIGGSSYNPCSASFVPPPHEQVEDLLNDLCAFCNLDSLPAIAQAAIAHAQFETIHPFVDGNGRTGRALIHVILRRRGLAAKVLPPVSLVLATWSVDYVDALMGTRYRGRSDSAAARSGLDRWIGLFAAATTRAVSDAELYEATVVELQDSWRARLGRVRAGSALALLIRRASGCARRDCPERRVAHRTQRAGEQRGHTSAGRSRRPPAEHRRPTQSCLRSNRTHRRLHRPRATAGQPNRRHQVISPGAGGAPPTAAARLTAVSVPWVVRMSSC